MSKGCGHCRCFSLHRPANKLARLAFACWLPANRTWRESRTQVSLINCRAWAEYSSRSVGGLAAALRAWSVEFVWFGRQLCFCTLANFHCLIEIHFRFRFHFHFAHSTWRANINATLGRESRASPDERPLCKVIHPCRAGAACEPRPQSQPQPQPQLQPISLGAARFRSPGMGRPACN